MAKVTICIMADKLLNGGVAMEHLETVLNENGYTVIDKRDAIYNEKHKRWETFYQCKFDEKSWCVDCQEYTIKTYGSWAYKGFKECVECGRRTYI